MNEAFILRPCIESAQSLTVTLNKTLMQSVTQTYKMSLPQSVHYKTGKLMQKLLNLPLCDIPRGHFH